MGYLESQIQEHSKSVDSREKLATCKTTSHGGYLTHDGIDVNGKRISDEIIQETERLESSGSKVTKFSIIGYSLGGLISRYAIGVLHHQKYFEGIEPVNFVTFCTPHIGAVNRGTKWHSRSLNAVSSYFLAHTGSQMFLNDMMLVKTERSGEKTEELPLLVWMAEPSSRFFIALSNFKYKALYANTINDRRTCWFTSAISTTDPFNSMVNQELSAYDLEYVKGYEPTVIDISKPISFAKLRNLDTINLKKRTIIPRIWNFSRILGRLLIIGPIWAVWLIISAIIERVRMNKRVSSFFNETSLLHLYENSHNQKVLKEQNKDQHPQDSFVSSLESGFNSRLRDQTDLFVESIFDAMSSEDYKDYEDVISKTKSREVSGQTTPNLEAQSSGVARNRNLNDLTKSRQGPVNLKGKRVVDFRINLSSSEKYIIERLNTLDWQKFPICIRNTKATHAAAVARHPDPNFEEGKTVVKHFINEIFQYD